MEAIFKLNLPMERKFQIPLPAGATILRIDVQDEKPTMWYRFTVTPEPLDAQAVKESHTIRAITTGEQFESSKNHFGLNYLGTVLLNGGGFVLHYFEEVFRA